MRLLAPLLALLTATACGGLTTKLCGAPGQPCCAESGCNSGALCTSAQLCEACGGEGQPCCATDACTGALACVSGACVQQVSCAVQCTLGASRCANGGVQTCRPAGVCPDWQSTVVSCPPGTDCVATADSADCVERCPGACVPNTLLCTVTGLSACVESGACPAMMSQVDDLDAPSCTTGAVIDADFVWESPAPAGVDFVDIAGDLPGNYWVLDDQGNILRYALGAWTYEWRSPLGRRMGAIATCGQVSRAYAVGEHGHVLRRYAAEWLEENVGADVLLSDVVCDFNRAWAVGTNGSLYLRENGVWTAYPTGVTAAFTGLTQMFSQSELYLSGPAGLVVRCDVSALPPTCAPESTGSVANLNAIWGDTSSNTVFAVGAGGTLLQRGATWSSIPLPGLTEDLVAVTGFYDRDSNLTYSVAVSAFGRVIVRQNATLKTYTVIPGAVLSNVWVPEPGTVVLTGALGSLWYRPGVDNPTPFVARGGSKPVKEDLYAVTSVGQGRLFAVGAKGTRVRRQNGAWQLDELGATTTENLAGVAARSAGEVYAVGNNGTVLLRRWGTWGFDALGLTTEDLKGVVVDSTRAWVLGETKLFEKNLALGTWRSIDVPAGTPPLAAVLLRVDGQGRAAELAFPAQGCTVVSFDPTAQAWSFVTGPANCVSNHDFLTGAFLSNGDLIVSSSVRGLYRRAGTTLVLEAAPGLDALPLWAMVADGSSMWAAGELGAVFRRVNTTWVETQDRLTNYGFYAGVKDDEGLFFVGAGGMVLRRQ